MSLVSKIAVSLLSGAVVGMVGIYAEQIAPRAAADGRTPAVSPGAVSSARVAAVSVQPDRALFTQYCVTCHNDRAKTGGLTLEAIDPAQVSANAEVLEKVVRKLSTGQMPPPGLSHPDKSTVDAFVTALEGALDRTAVEAPNPGRLTVHRLTRLEYINAVHDLLGFDVEVALLPADGGGVGFDNNADVLGLTPALMNRYMLAATKISRAAIGDPSIGPTTTLYKAARFGRQIERMSEDLPFGTRGGVVARHMFPLDGLYTIRLRLARTVFVGHMVGAEFEHDIDVRVDDVLVKRFTVGGKYKGADPGAGVAIAEDDIEGRKLHEYRNTLDKDLVFELAVKAGQHLVTATFPDRRAAVSELVPRMPSSIRGSTDDLGQPAGIGEVEISGPSSGSAPVASPIRQRIFSCYPASAREEESCARTILGRLARRAYRRPVTDVDVQELMQLYALGRASHGFEAGIGRALEGLLVMPAFLVRVEHDPVGEKPGMVYRISNLELASRLSFFLWKSIPDDELLDVAVSGRLSNPSVLKAQVRRMLADARSSRWMDDFVDQWLTIRNLHVVEPDPQRFPEFDDNLREAMLKETELFFESQVRGDASTLDLLRADYTYLNEQLARYYGVPDVYGSHFRRVPVTNPARQGLLGHASVLTVTSYANRTSVVLRGKWVLETLLGTPPPPPPPNVPPLKENDGKSAPSSLRERMEQHRRNTVCASCHSRMDPLGFALENFDGTGRWRDDDEGVPVDPTSTLPDGTKIDGPEAFRQMILGRGDQYLRTVTEKLFAYAVGRSVAYYDQPTLRRIVREMAPNGSRWSDLIAGIVSSPAFQERRVQEPEARLAENVPASRR
jgi:mono/diheme cytochrome c family protein